ncbi:MAG: hypothetical protein KatS3mg110_1870 [Pirellulaceae bacterium]|nr:MAG: hypothetical protein KatS3mg110_1870 [Pirellulaceae bacterium]
MTPPHDQIDWDAFRYLYGEMTPEELAYWDERLLEDAGARRSLEKAIHLAAALERVFAERCVAQRRAPSRRTAVYRSAVWFAAVAAALLVLAHFANLTSHKQESPVDDISHESTELPHLAKAWLHTYQTAALDAEVSDFGAGQRRDLADGPEWFEPDPFVPVYEGPSVAPSWMMLAVAELHTKGEADDMVEGRP